MLRAPWLGAALGLVPVLEALCGCAECVSMREGQVFCVLQCSGVTLEVAIMHQDMKTWNSLKKKEKKKQGSLCFDISCLVLKFNIGHRDAV